MKNINLNPIINFLGCETPKAWCEMAITNLPTLLLDHAHCEKKAASTAITILFRYPEYEDLVYRLSRIAREELRHFEQVLIFLKKHNIPFRHLQPSHYADELRKLVATYEPQRLIDILIIGAFIEARSCERFASLLPYLENDLKDFYYGLLASEARHFEIYLNFAKQIASSDISERVEFFRKKEAELIMMPDETFRFHSGNPVNVIANAC